MAVSSSCTLACLPNRAGSGIMSAESSASSDLLPANLQSDVLSKPWRSEWQSWRESSFQWTAPTVSSVFGTRIDPSIVEAVAMIRHNCGPSSLWRATGVPTAARYERLPPTSVVSSGSSWTGDGGGAVAAGEIDEDCSGTLDATFAKSPEGGGILVLGFATPSAQPMLGFDVQEFRFQLRFGVQDVAGAKIYLYESGAQKKQLGEILDMTTTTQEYVFRWNATDLTTTTGANAEVGIELENNIGAATLWIDAVEWNVCNDVASVNATWDSGILGMFDTFAAQEFGDATLDDVISDVNFTASHLTDDSTEIAFLNVDIWRVENDTRSAYDSSQPGLPQVGNFRAGGIFVPSQNCKAVDIGIDAFGKRTYEVTFNLLTRSETLQNLYLWGSLSSGVASRVTRTESGGTFVRGRGGPFCVLNPQPNETGVQTLQNSLVRISGRAKYKDMGMIAGASTMQVTIPMTEW